MVNFFWVSECVCVCVCVCTEPADGYPSTPGPNAPLGRTILHCEYSAGVSGCQLASVYYWCAVYRGRPSGPSVTTLGKWVKEMKIKPVQRGCLGPGVLLASSARVPL